jgi:hypothetical protein
MKSGKKPPNPSGRGLNRDPEHQRRAALKSAEARRNRKAMAAISRDEARRMLFETVDAVETARAALANIKLAAGIPSMTCCPDCGSENATRVRENPPNAVEIAANKWLIEMITGGVPAVIERVVTEEQWLAATGKALASAGVDDKTVKIFQTSLQEAMSRV